MTEKGGGLPSGNAGATGVSAAAMKIDGSRQAAADFDIDSLFQQREMASQRIFAIDNSPR